MRRKRQQMMAMIRRHPLEIVLEPSLRNNLVKEGLIAEYKNGDACMAAGCSLCAVMACPTCGRVDRRGEAVLLVDHEPHVLLGDQAVIPHAPDLVREI